ncbi:MAG: ferrous iron transport protein A [Phycisphaeraceae bacterium]|nr:ferrous iron transport protein A [Phycisphaeraceae bacterium]
MILDPSATANSDKASPAAGCCGNPAACTGQADARPVRRQAPLASLTPGQTGTICECALSDDDASMLRAMGLGIAARIRLCRAGQPCIVALGCVCREHAADGEGGTLRDLWGGGRIGLARPLAERIIVLLDA